jgi:alpha-mannosidase
MTESSDRQGDGAVPGRLPRSVRPGAGRGAEKGGGTGPFALNGGGRWAKLPAMNEPRDFTREKVFFVVPYAHLDSQWRWDYAETIGAYLKNTIEGTLRALARYRSFIYNKSAAWHYALMKEYYPQYWPQVRAAVKSGRWHPCGAMFDETDPLNASAESVVRNILYGNRWLKAELGVENDDYILPDSFGFHSSLPTILAHCGIKGFSTQKLTWGLWIDPPFGLGRWVGPDGSFVLAALDCTDYEGKISAGFANDPAFVRRLEDAGRKCGIYADYRYFGVGDIGGPLRDEDLANLDKAVKRRGKFKIVVAASGEPFRAFSVGQAAMLPSYAGELLLTGHSSGSSTSQAEMKRCNRRAERLAQSAEAFCAVADWLGALPYDRAAFRRNWERVLASQFHDNLPGTAIPEAYDNCYNDEAIALGGFGGLLRDAAEAVAGPGNPRAGKGRRFLVWNALAFEREDIAEFEGLYAAAFDERGRRLPLSRDAAAKRTSVLVRVPSCGYAVVRLEAGRLDAPPRTGVKAMRKGNGWLLENARYAVTLDVDGDLAGVYDKRLKRELLRSPARLEFLHERPEKWPAWNMDWADRKRPPEGHVGGRAEISVTETGSARVAIRVRRRARGSTFVQTFRLAAGDAGERLEAVTEIEWRGKACSLKWAFPLTAENQWATYYNGLNTDRRETDHRHCFEMLSAGWIDLTDAGGAFGVSVLDDCKYASDKPDGRTLRPTLLYTPGVREHYLDQQWQDWGRHAMTHALFAHEGEAGLATQRHCERLNQPLAVLPAGSAEKGRSFLSLEGADNVEVRALKKAEDGGAFIVRLQEVCGRPFGPAALSFGDGAARAWLCDGQERPLPGGSLKVRGGRVLLPAGTRYALRTVAFIPAGKRAVRPSGYVPLRVPFDRRLTSAEGAGETGYPAELFPFGTLASGGVEFAMAPGGGRADAAACAGQEVALPQGTRALRLIAAAERDTKAVLRFGGKTATVFIPAWNQPVGNWDRRVFEGPVKGGPYVYDRVFKGIAKGFRKDCRVAWFATHHHTPEGNAAYKFCYLFDVAAEVPEGATGVTLPDDRGVWIFAMAAKA